MWGMGHRVKKVPKKFKKLLYRIVFNPWQHPSTPPKFNRRRTYKDN
jgi:hypothetical protein